MVKQVKVSNFTEVKGIVSAAAKCYNAVGVHDMKGSIADAKSILGMMSLDYSHPVKIVCEDEGDMSRIISAIKQEFGNQKKQGPARCAASSARRAVFFVRLWAKQRTKNEKYKIRIRENSRENKRIQELCGNILKFFAKIVDLRPPFCYNHTCAKKRRGRSVCPAL